MSQEIIKDYVIVYQKKFYDYKFRIVLSLGNSINILKISLSYSNDKRFGELLDEINIDVFKKRINYYIETLNTILCIFNEYENQEGK
jgi:hypothetical protein